VEAPQQRIETDVLTHLHDMPIWEVGLIILFPAIIGVIITWGLVWQIKKHQRANRRESSTLLLVSSIMIGGGSGALMQWILSDLDMLLLHIDFPMYRAMAMSGVIAASVAAPTWVVLLSFIKRRGWDRLYRALKLDRRSKPRNGTGTATNKQPKG